MIDIALHENRAGRLVRINIDGHADKTDLGRRVCTGVSVIARTLLIATKQDVNAQMRNGTTIIHTDKLRTQRGKAFLEMALIGWQVLEEHCPQHVRVTRTSAVRR